MAELEQRIEDNSDTDFERSDWPLGKVALAFLAIFAVLVIAPLILIVAYPSAVADVDRRLAAPLPAPRLQVDPEKEYARFRVEEQKKLDGYYWVDRQKGIVHIPIAAAMQKLVRGGIDGFPRGQQ